MKPFPIKDTMRDTLERFKPAASRRIHLFVAGLMWTLVGLGLAAAGIVWCLGAGLPNAFFYLIPGVLVGMLKGVFVLSRAARRSAERIESRGDGVCLGGFISWGSWGLVLVMMGTGVLLRHSALPRAWLGLIYTAIGSALLTGSRVFWRVFVHVRQG